MIKVIDNEDLLKSDAVALVNTVNCIGVSGKGVALAFRNKYPKETRVYNKACQDGKVVIGKMFVTRVLNDSNKWIINFPTKKHWRNESQLEWIDEGLDDLRQLLIDSKLKSIAIPPLGCGLGKLDWIIVKQLIINKLYDLDTDIRIHQNYSPKLFSM